MAVDAFLFDVEKGRRHLVCIVLDYGEAEAYRLILFKAEP
jgi:hypothetical protein